MDPDTPPAATAALLLAAGTSRRFGVADKLLAPLDGVPLVTHAAAALRAAGFSPLIAVTSSDRVAALLPGFTIVRLPDGPAAQSRSLAAGVAEAARHAPDRLVVALADMPGVTPALLLDVANRCPPGGAAAATERTRPLPPACFDRALFPALQAMQGDRGAAPILRDLPPSALVAAAPDLLIDIDTREELAALETRLKF